MYIGEILKRDKNNLDLFRAISAFLVIWGHAYALAPEAGHRDFVRQLLGFDYSGSLAVKIFFFLSGLLVARSLLSSGSVRFFLLSRFFRIFPGLLFVLVVCAFILGPLVSTWTAEDYFSSKVPYNYVLWNFFMEARYNLPGVFEGNPYKAAVNGSLWTISYEVAAYLLLVAAFAIGCFHNKKFATVVLLFLVAEPLLDNALVFSWFNGRHEVSMLAPVFAFGVLLALYQDRVFLDFKVIVGLWLLVFLLRKSELYQYAFYAALFCSIIRASASAVVLRLRVKSDVSYGVYLWGFPVQQCVVLIFPQYGLLGNQLISISICVVMGLLSWKYIERPAIDFCASLRRRLISPVAYAA